MLTNIILVQQAVVAVFILIIILLVVYYIIFIGFKSHPQMVGIGHSEEFESYMEVYLQEFCYNLKYIQDINNDRIGSIDLSSLKRANQDFIDTFQSSFKKDLTRVSQFEPNDIPELYILFMFNKAIRERNDQDVALMTIFFEFEKIQHFFQKGSKTTLQPLKDSKLANTHDKFSKLRDVIGDLSNTISKMSDDERAKLDHDDNDILTKILIFDLFYNTYVTGKTEVIKDNITKMFDMRKSGGVANATIFKIYMQDYVDFIFIEKIRDGIWGKSMVIFKEDAKNVSEKIQNAFASESIASAIKNLPFKIAGIENFEDYKETFIGQPLHAGPNDKTEHFFQALIQIAKVFVAMFKIVTAIVKVIDQLTSDPTIIFRWVIGLIIGITIYIIYILLLISSFIWSYIIGYVWIFWIKAFFTVIWTAVFVLIGFLYSILWVLDFATGGLIFKMLRCENLPNSWHTRPNIAYGNRFTRSILCMRPCTSRYTPRNGFCKRLPDYQPSYCPQQILFNYYAEHKSSDFEKNLHIVNYVPNPKYHLSMNRAEQQEKWVEVYKTKVDYSKKCSRKMYEYDHISKQICYALSKDENIKNKPIYNKLREVCKIYCDDPNTKNNLEFCKDPPEVEDILEEPQPEPQDIITSITFNLLLIVTMVFIFYGLYMVYKKGTLIKQT